MNWLLLAIRTERSLGWQQRPVPVPLRLQTRLRGWLNLMSLNIATRICSGSIKLTTSIFLSAIQTIPTFFHSYSPSVSLGLTTREEKFSSQPLPRRPVTRRVKMFHRGPSCILDGVASVTFLHDDIGFKRCGIFSGPNSFHRLRFLCWYNASYDMTSAQSWNRNSTNRLTFQLRKLALSMAISCLSR